MGGAKPVILMKADLGKLVAATVGVGVCLLALTAWGLPTSGSPPGLDLRLIVAPPGELTVDPAGVLASARAMRAGDDPARGVIEARNITGRSLLVRPVALPSVRGLARTVRLRAAIGDRTLAAGRLASLERPARARGRDPRPRLPPDRRQRLAAGGGKRLPRPHPRRHARTSLPANRRPTR